MRKGYNEIVADCTVVTIQSDLAAQGTSGVLRTELIPNQSTSDQISWGESVPSERVDVDDPTPDVESIVTIISEEKRMSDSVGFASVEVLVGCNVDEREVFDAPPHACNGCY